MEQDRAARAPTRAADRPLVRGDAQRQFRRDDRGQLPQRRQSGARRAEAAAALGLYRELRKFRGSAPGRIVSAHAARDRPGEAARGDARIREIRVDDTANEIFLLW